MNKKIQTQRERDAILHYLSENPGSARSAIHKALLKKRRKVKATRLTTLLSGLVKDGLVVRNGNKKGARYVANLVNEHLVEETDVVPAEPVISSLFKQKKDEIIAAVIELDKHRAEAVKDRMALRLAIENFLSGTSTTRDLGQALLEDGRME